VFFSGCSLGCVYCQNYDISKRSVGKEIDIGELAEHFLYLQEKGANNINLVTATHFVPQVIRSLQNAVNQGLTLPVVYNSSGYENVDTLKMLEGYVDVYLPDFKYMDKVLAGKYSKAADYPEVAKQAIAEMVRQCPKAVFMQEKDVSDESLIMTKGVIVRHLVLPGYIEDSKRVIEYLVRTYKDDVFLSIMNQYTPMEQIKKHPLLSRKVTKREYSKVVDYALSLGWENGFIQEGETAKESFIPGFNGVGV
jgi:putative pyruvate formate lyase activating enzyme